MEAKAFSNNDIALILWQYDQKLNGCLGFAIERINTATQEKEFLPAWVGFKTQKNEKWKAKNTAVWPIQKFNWRDFTAKRGQTYKFSIIPVFGTPSKPEPSDDNSLILTTNEVALSPEHGEFKAYFNRGILATQFLARELPVKGKKEDPDILKERIRQLNDPLRERLTGQLNDALIHLIWKAIKEGGKCYCALYELSDPELLSLLLRAGDKIHLILSNTGDDDETNAVARQALHDSRVKIYDRMLGSGHIGHNKFVVYVDSNDKPGLVLSGSTNWTSTGLCTQTNNAIIIESEEVARAYLDYWNRLLDDKAKQDGDFRTANNAANSFQISQTNLDLWFSPNTKQKTKPKNPAAPSDMAQIFELMQNAKKAILFLAFDPGTPSIIDKASECQTNNLDLFIRGAITKAEHAEKYNAELFHRGIDKPDTVIAASNVKKDFAFWKKELLKAGWAIIHDKIVVIDPFTDDCVVVTGSHNLGYKASYANDENLLIIKGHKELAAAYTVHIMDVYDHYRWRYKVNKSSSIKSAFYGLETNDSWQDKYFKANAKERLDMVFWK
jgi:phosphatidylserine/phosphatidylglycerophosphate/cardiolipin synthase-like enzyme